MGLSNIYLISAYSLFPGVWGYFSKLEPHIYDGYVSTLKVG